MDLHVTVETMLEEGPLFSGAAVAIGNFDGVHLGHAHILRQAVRAAAPDGPAVVLTFDPHPQAVVGDGAPAALSTAAKRYALMRSLGIDAVVRLHFDRAVAALPPERFVTDVLVRGLGVADVVVGDNFRFGHRARGTTDMLRRLGRQHSFTLHEMAAVRDDGDIVSSSAIRQHLAAGDVTEAARMLGRKYCVVGTVVRGDGRGRKLGFPTANVHPAEGVLLPAPGVYAATFTGGSAANFAALAVIGTRPTFGGDETVLEVHVLDYDEDVYDASVEVRFVRRLRDVMRFSSPEHLRTQMRADVEKLREPGAKPTTLSGTEPG